MSYYPVGSVIRMPHYSTMAKARRRVWKVMSHCLGGLEQEGYYELKPLDVADHGILRVPCLMLETHPSIEQV